MTQTVKVTTLIEKGDSVSSAMLRARLNAAELFHLHCVSDTKVPILGPTKIDGTPGDPTGDVQMTTEWTIGS